MYFVYVYAVGFRVGMICNMMTILQTSCCLFSLATLHFRTITMLVVPCKLFAFFFTRETHLSRMRKNPSNLQLKYSHTFSTRRWWFPVINTFDLFCFISTQVLQISFLKPIYYNDLTLGSKELSPTAENKTLLHLFHPHNVFWWLLSFQIFILKL